MSSLPKSKQLRIYISDGLLSAVERNAHILTQSRTKFIATAITRFLRHSPKVSSINDYPEHHDYVRFELLDRQRQMCLRMPPMLIERIRSHASEINAQLDDVIAIAIIRHLADLPTLAAKVATLSFNDHAAAVSQHLAVEYRRLWSRTGPRPELVMVSMSFNSKPGVSDKISSAYADNLFRYFDQFFRHLCSYLLGSHWQNPNKRFLQPLTYAWIDVGGSRHASRFFRGKRQPSYWSSNGGHSAKGIPSDLPHVHAVMLVHPQVAASFRSLLRYGQFGLSQLMSGLSCRSVETLPIEPLLTPEEARKVYKSLRSRAPLNSQIAAKIAALPDVAEAFRHVQLMVQKYPPVNQMLLPRKLGQAWHAFWTIAACPRFLQPTRNVFRDVHIQLARKQDLSKVVGYCSKHLQGEGRSQRADLYQVWPKSKSESNAGPRRRVGRIAA